MTYQESIDVGEDCLNIIENCLTLDNVSSFDEIPSLRKIITENTDKTGSVWSATKKYNKGDIISYGNKFYYAKYANINSVPTLLTNWTVKTYNTIAGTVGYDKFGLFTGAGALLRGSDTILAIEKVATGHFKVHFVENFNDLNYLCIIKTEKTNINNDFFNVMIQNVFTNYVEFKSWNCTLASVLADAETYSIACISKV